MTAGPDSPITGSRVVNRIVEFSGRQQLRRARQSGAHVVIDGQIAMRGTEHARQILRRDPSHLAGTARHFQRYRDGVRRAPSFSGRQQHRRGPRLLCHRHGRSAAQNLAGHLPPRHAGTPEPNSRDRYLKRTFHCVRSAENNSTQLFPPKPKLSVKATRTGAASPVSFHCGPQSGSNSRASRFPGRNP